MSNNDQTLEQEIEQSIKRIQEVETDNFFELAQILGRNPKKDLAGADLHGCDLSGGDLQGANLRKTNLKGANLSHADIRNADFTGADLTDTIFNQVRAKNAIFDDNRGMNEDIKQDLAHQGAIFRNNLSANSSEVSVDSDILRVYNPSILGFFQYILFDEFTKIPFDRRVRSFAPIERVWENEDETIPSNNLAWEIAALERVEKNESVELIEPTQEKFPLNFIVKLFSWTLVITFAVIFLYIIYQAVILNNERANIIIYHAFTLILGCFIGGLTTYLKMASEQKYR